MFLDLIQLKSPATSPNGKLAGDVVTPQRRRSADVADTPQYYTEHERINHVNTNSQSERVNSAILTPTATSFSKDELNEIFNISRHSMDIVERSATLTSPGLDISSTSMQHTPSSSSTTTNMVASPSDKPHNIALDESNFSMDSSSVMESSCVSQTDSELNSSKCMSDNNNNMKNGGSAVATVPSKTDNRPQIVHMEGTAGNKSTDLSPPANSNKAGSLSKLQMVCREIFMTEKSYVNDLQDIIEVCMFWDRKT